MNPLDIAQLAYGGFQTIKGLFQQGAANKLARENVRPVADTAGLYDDLVTKFSAESQYGIDRNAMTFANEANQNNLSGGLSAMLMAGGSPNAASSLYGTYTGSTEKLAIADSDKRWQKVNALAGIVDKQNDAKIQDWLYNKDAPYKDKARLAAQKQMMGYNQTMTGADYTMGALVRTAGHYQEDNKVAPPTGGGYAASPAYVNAETVSQRPAYPAAYTGKMPDYRDPITAGVYSPSSMFATPPGSAHGWMADVMGNKIKGYDSNGNPIY